MHTVSVASLIALVMTRSGCITPFVYMSMMHLSFTLMPTPTLPSAWAVRVEMRYALVISNE